ncbi:hypothetical protein A4A49_32978 [Nicotiana attenuata]|uniref:Uncharacterized protein n=1 Tax=Nicotiana attenuata TaxID=49451 RepID=A0A1J6JYK8_NICAT|nr:hypothetical protein A4A49_32978 [Nicotiana attenuata]
MATSTSVLFSRLFRRPLPNLCANSSRTEIEYAVNVFFTFKTFEVRSLVILPEGEAGVQVNVSVYLEAANSLNELYGVHLRLCSCQVLLNLPDCYWR